MEAIINRLEARIKAAISRSVGEQKKNELDPELSKHFESAKTESRQGQTPCPHKAVINIKPEDVEKTFGISVDPTGGNWTISAEDRIAIPQHLSKPLSERYYIKPLLK